MSQNTDKVLACSDRTGRTLQIITSVREIANNSLRGANEMSDPRRLQTRRLQHLPRLKSFLLAKPNVGLRRRLDSS